MKLKKIIFQLASIVALNLSVIYLSEFMRRLLTISKTEVLFYSILSAVLYILFGAFVNLNASSNKYEGKLTTSIILFIVSFIISSVPIISILSGTLIPLIHFPNTPVIVINQFILGYILVDLYRYKIHKKENKK